MSWPTVNLAEVTAKIGSGATPRGGESAYKSTGVPLIRSMNVHDGDFVEDGIAYLDNEQAASLDNVVVRRGDVLLNITGASVARVCSVPDRYAGARVNQHVSIVRPDKNKLDTSFLAHLLMAPETKRRLLRVAGAGATREAITKAQIAQFEILLPPLLQQRRIARILDEANALRRRRKRALNLLDSLTQSIFEEMFGDENHSAFEVRPLSSVTTQITDGAHFTPTYVDKGVPFLRVTDIQSASIDWSNVRFIPKVEHRELIKRCNPSPGDVLLSKNGTIGVPRFVDWTDQFSIFVSLCLIKPDKRTLSGRYLTAFLKTAAAQRQLRQHAKTGTVTNLHLIEIRNLRIPVPALEDQLKWEEREDSFKTIKARADLAFRQTDSLFASLQHRAFSGQL